MHVYTALQRAQRHGSIYGLPNMRMLWITETFIRSLQSRQASLLCSIMLNILGEADGDEGLQKAHEVMARAYSVSH